MTENINEQVQDGYVLLTATRKYQPELDGFGVSVAETQNLETSIGNLESKDAAHKEARNTEKEKKRLQDDQIALSWKQIRKIQNIAKGVFGHASPILKDFHIGKRPSKSVSETLTELVYFKEIGTRYQGDLAARGLKAEDLTALESLHAALAATDSDQENAKRLQTAAMSARTAADEELRALKYRIRQSAEGCFADNPEVLKEFKSIIQHKKSAKTATEEETTGATTG